MYTKSVMIYNYSVYNNYYCINYYNNNYYYNSITSLFVHLTVKYYIMAYLECQLIGLLLNVQVNKKVHKIN